MSDHESAANPPGPEACGGGLPTADSERDRSISAMWSIAVLAIVAAAYLTWTAWEDRGTRLEVRFASGDGISEGDAVRYRGIAVGRVIEVALDRVESGVLIVIECEDAVAAMAGEQSRFWVVRPRLDLRGVAGLDTVVGPRYLEMRPAGSPPSTSFRGLDEAPVVEEISEGDLQLVLEARERGSLRRGAAVQHRGVRVGDVLSVALADDGRQVEAEVLIRANYAHLVKRNTEFFQVGAVEVGLSLDGLRTRIDSIETLLLGGVGFATPDSPSASVVDGSRFRLELDPPGH